MQISVGAVQLGRVFNAEQLGTFFVQSSIDAKARVSRAEI
jgi:hypothetical protein